MKIKGIEPEKTYLPIEAAKFIGVTYQVLLRYLRDGTLEGRKVFIKGKRKGWRIYGRKIIKFIREHPKE